jgi:hypothetical protein
MISNFKFGLKHSLSSILRIKLIKIMESTQVIIFDLEIKNDGNAVITLKHH